MMKPGYLTEEKHHENNYSLIEKWRKLEIVNQLRDIQASYLK